MNRLVLQNMGEPIETGCQTGQLKKKGVKFRRKLYCTSFPFETLSQTSKALSEGGFDDGDNGW